MLIDSANGSIIGSVSEAAGGGLNSNGITLLSNGNYVIQNPATTNAVTGSGFVILVNGTTGNEIARISGDNPNDQFGYYDVVELKNGNYVMRNPLDDSNGLTNNGSVILVNGSTGVEIARLVGDQSENKSATIGL
jgi:hypothetical protein